MQLKGRWRSRFLNKFREKVSRWHTYQNDNNLMRRIESILSARSESASPDLAISMQRPWCKPLLGAALVWVRAVTLTTLCWLCLGGACSTSAFMHPYFNFTCRRNSFFKLGWGLSANWPSVMSLASQLCRKQRGHLRGRSVRTQLNALKWAVWRCSAVRAKRTRHIRAGDRQICFRHLISNNLPA